MHVIPNSDELLVGLTSTDPQPQTPVAYDAHAAHVFNSQLTGHTHRVLVSVMPDLQDHDTSKEGGEYRANESQRLEVGTNEGADAVAGAGAAAAAALGRGARGGGIGAGLHASAVGGGEAGCVAVGASELNEGQARDLSAGVVVDSGGHVGGSLMNIVSFKILRVVPPSVSTHHAGNGSARGGGDSRGHQVITTAGALGKVPVGQECGLGDER